MILFQIQILIHVLFLILFQIQILILDLILLKQVQIMLRIVATLSSVLKPQTHGHDHQQDQVRNIVQVQRLRSTIHYTLYTKNFHACCSLPAPHTLSRTIFNFRSSQILPLPDTPPSFHRPPSLS
jgi:hypothetical protein